MKRLFLFFILLSLIIITSGRETIDIRKEKEAIKELIEEDEDEDEREDEELVEVE